MGEPIEITTWPKHQNMFYRVTSSALMVDVKAVGNAKVGLAKKPGEICEYWIGIGDSRNNRCWIKRGSECCKKASTPNILSPNDYRSFWISWNGDSIQLGRYGETKPIVACSNHVKDLNYVTFSVLQEINPVYWKFELPPHLEKPMKFRPVTGGKSCWVEPTNSQLPDGAMIGGFEKETLYIIRSRHRGSLTPGKFVPSQGTGYISWGGQCYETTDFEVLCGFDCAWVPTCDSRIPVGAIEAGYSEEYHERLYVGRALLDGHLIPGKVQPSHKVCYVPYEGQEVAKNTYEVLVEPYTNYTCVNKVFVSDIQAGNYSESDNDDSNHSWMHDAADIYDNNSDDEMAYAF